MFVLEKKYGHVEPRLTSNLQLASFILLGNRMTPLKPWGSFQFREGRQLKIVQWEVRFRENCGIFVLSNELRLFFMVSSTIFFGG